MSRKGKEAEAKAKTQEQIIKEAMEIFSTPASKKFFRKLAEEQRKK